MKVVVGTLLKEYSGLAGLRGEGFRQGVLQDLGAQKKRQFNGGRARRGCRGSEQEQQQKE